MLQNFLLDLGFVLWKRWEVLGVQPCALLDLGDWEGFGWLLFLAVLWLFYGWLLLIGGLHCASSVAGPTDAIGLLETIEGRVFDKQWGTVVEAVARHTRHVGDAALSRPLRLLRRVVVIGGLESVEHMVFVLLLLLNTVD